MGSHDLAALLCKLRGLATGCLESTHKTLFPLLLTLRHLLDQPDFLSRLIDAIVNLVDLEYNPDMPTSDSGDSVVFLLSDTRLQALRLGSLLIQYMKVRVTARMEQSRR